MDIKKDSLELADKMLYNSMREKGLSHDESLLEMGRIKAQVEFEQRQYQRTESSQTASTTSNSSDITDNYADVRSYYQNKALKYFIQLALLSGLLIFFSIPTEGQPFNPSIIIENAAFLFLIGVLLLTISLISKIFGNFIIGTIVGLLAFFTLGEKYTVFMENHGITIAQQDTLFGIMGLIYLLIVLILFIYNFRNSRI